MLIKGIDLSRLHRMPSLSSYLSKITLEHPYKRSLTGNFLNGRKTLLLNRKHYALRATEYVHMGKGIVIAFGKK